MDSQGDTVVLRPRTTTLRSRISLVFRVFLTHFSSSPALPHFSSQLSIILQVAFPQLSIMLQDAFPSIHKITNEAEAEAEAKALILF